MSSVPEHASSTVAIPDDPQELAELAARSMYDNDPASQALGARPPAHPRGGALKQAGKPQPPPHPVGKDAHRVGAGGACGNIAPPPPPGEAAAPAAAHPRRYPR